MQSPGRGTRPAEPEKVWELLRCIAEGSFGAVWEGREYHSRKRVAIKVGKAGIATYNRDCREATITSYLSKNGCNKCIRYVDDCFTVDRKIWIVIEYLSPVWKPMESFLYDTRASHSEKDRLVVFAHVFSALAQVHNLGVAHHDINRGNIMVNVSKVGGGGGEAKLIDFGLACLVDRSRKNVDAIMASVPHLGGNCAEVAQNAGWCGHPVGRPCPSGRGREDDVGTTMYLHREVLDVIYHTTPGQPVDYGDGRTCENIDTKRIFADPRRAYASDTYGVLTMMLQRFGNGSGGNDGYNNGDRIINDPEIRDVLTHMKDRPLDQIPSAAEVASFLTAKVVELRNLREEAIGITGRSQKARSVSPGGDR